LYPKSIGKYGYSMNFHDIPFLSADFLHRNENMTHDEIVDLPMKDGDFPKLFV
jgi:hypothetical protein